MDAVRQDLPRVTLAAMSYHFRGFAFDPTCGVISRPGGDEIRLRPQSTEVFQYLLDRAQRVVGREEILQTIWPDVEVTEQSITQCVSDIRRALGAGGSELLRTLPKRGYMFSTEVRREASGLPLPDKPSIVVLAFSNMSGDPEQEYFSDGIAEDIITELSRSRFLFVIARNSSFAYKGRAFDVQQVARELGVRYVLEGSVRRSGERLRIVARLIDAESGNHIWAERYDRGFADVFAVQDEITAAVVWAIRPAVADAEYRRVLRKPPEGLRAWEAYQRGLWHMGRDTSQARDFFLRAITLDATLAPAYAAMAMAWLRDGVGFGTRTVQESTRFAIEWARKCIEIDATEADAHAVLAWAVATSGNLDESEGTARLALEINPSSPWANCAVGAHLVFGGQPQQGREALLTALRLSPSDAMNPAIYGLISASYYFEREYQRAVEAGRRAISLFPNHPTVYRYLAASLGQVGLGDEGRAMLERANEISSRYFDLTIRNRPPWYRPEDYAHLLEGLRLTGWQG
jgi:adenylate cyclase